MLTKTKIKTNDGLNKKLKRAAKVRNQIWSKWNTVIWKANEQKLR